MKINENNSKTSKYSFDFAFDSFLNDLGSAEEFHGHLLWQSAVLRAIQDLPTGEKERAFIELCLLGEDASMLKNAA